MTQAANPFFGKFKTPRETAPFDKIKITDYEPAFQEGIRQHQKEVDAIVNQRSTPTFENTIEALERSGSLLNKVSTIFFAVSEAEGNYFSKNLAYPLRTRQQYQSERKIIRTGQIRLRQKRRIGFISRTNGPIERYL